VARLRLTFILALVALTVGCGSSSNIGSNNGGGTNYGGGTNNGGTAQSQLNPQGNWLFRLIYGSNSSRSFTGQLFELYPPAVTAPSGLRPIGAACTSGYVDDNLYLLTPSQVTGTADVTFNFQQQTGLVQAATYTLTGTIATDQLHMSGIYTGSSPCESATSGTWTAQVIPSVTGNWAGSGGGMSAVFNITENADKTSPNLGQLSGTFTTAGGSPCIPDATYNIEHPMAISTNQYVSSSHVGEIVFLFSQTSSGLTITGEFDSVEPGATTMTGSLDWVGNPQSMGNGFTFTLNRQ